VALRLNDHAIFFEAVGIRRFGRGGKSDFVRIEETNCVTPLHSLPSIGPELALVALNRVFESPRCWEGNDDEQETIGDFDVDRVGRDFAG
jgi:hypothetical protein